MIYKEDYIKEDFQDIITEISLVYSEIQFHSGRKKNSAVRYIRNILYNNILKY